MKLKTIWMVELKNELQLTTQYRVVSVGIRGTSQNVPIGRNLYRTLISPTEVGFITCQTQKVESHSALMRKSCLLPFPFSS